MLISTISTQDCNNYFISALPIKNTSTVIHLLSLLQVSLQMSLRDDILHYPYKGISTIMVRPLSLHTSLPHEFLQLSLLASLRSEILQLSLLTPLQSKFVLASLWTIFLRRFYEDILTATTIPSKSEILVPGIQVKPETPITWLPLCSALHSYLKLFYKFATYYMIDHIYNIDTWKIRKQVVEYLMSLKRKRGAKLKAKGCAEGRYHRVFNNVLESSSDLLRSNTHKGCCVLNATDYNYKLRSVIGREDGSKVMTNRHGSINKCVTPFYVHG